MRFLLLLASTLVHKTYLCDGSVALQAISQGLASFNTQIVGTDVDLCTECKKTIVSKRGGKNSHCYALFAACEHTCTQNVPV